MPRKKETIKEEMQTEQAETKTEQAETKTEQVETEEICGLMAEKCNGKIKLIFDGALRIRAKPSWDDTAVKGVMTFTEKRVTHKIIVDEKVMYRTADGYFVSGDAGLVEYIED